MIYKCQKCGFPNSFQKRSSRMNKYLHVCIGILGNELGYDINEMKSVLKSHFGYFKTVPNKLTGEEVISYDETSKMNSKECSEFINQIIRFASEQGIVIATPEEYFEK